MHGPQRVTSFFGSATARRSTIATGHSHDFRFVGAGSPPVQQPSDGWAPASSPRRNLETPPRGGAALSGDGRREGAPLELAVGQDPPRRARLQKPGVLQVREPFLQGQARGIDRLGGGGGGGGGGTGGLDRAHCRSFFFLFGCCFVDPSIESSAAPAASAVSATAPVVRSFVARP